MTYGWTTNVHFFNNDFFSNVTNGSVGFSSGSYGGQYGLIGTNNLYYSPIYDLTGQTNYISYANGSRFKVIYAFNAATVYALTDTNASQNSSRRTDTYSKRQFKFKFNPGFISTVR
jgi:hypothetical protein